jgi:hypothetical protein
MTNESGPVPFIKQMQYVQEFAARVDFSDKDRVIEVMRGCNAFARPEDNVRLRMPG